MVSREAVGRQPGPPPLRCLWSVVGMHPALLAAPPSGAGTTPIAQFRSPPWGDFRLTLLVSRPYRPDTGFEQIVSQQVGKVKKQKVKPGPRRAARASVKNPDTTITSASAQDTLDSAIRDEPWQRDEHEKEE